MLNAVLPALHLLNRRKGFFHESKYQFCHSFISQHHERQTAEIYQMLVTGPFAE